MLIDYDYALDLANGKRKFLLSPVSPKVWPRSLRKNGSDMNFYISHEQLSPKEKALQKQILSLLEVGETTTWP